MFLQQKGRKENLVLTQATVIFKIHRSVLLMEFVQTGDFYLLFLEELIEI